MRDGEGDGGAPTVAVVDDDEISRFVLVAILGRLGFRTLEARDGDEGVDLVLANRPDAVLMDINMPRMNGVDALRAIRARDPGLPVRVLAVTANTSAAQRQECAASGFDDFIEKPVDIERLKGALLHVLAGL
jgi:CheY-like chemotaxis protein